MKNITDWYDRQFTISKGIVTEELDEEGETIKEIGGETKDVVCYLTKNEAVEVFNNDCYPNKHFRINPDLDPLTRYWPLYEEKGEDEA